MAYVADPLIAVRAVPHVGRRPGEGSRGTCLRRRVSWVMATEQERLQRLVAVQDEIILAEHESAAISMEFSEHLRILLDGLTRTLYPRVGDEDRALIDRVRAAADMQPIEDTEAPTQAI